MREKDIGYLIKGIDEKLKAGADRDLKSHNLTMMQSAVLLFLCRRDDAQATQKEIETHLGVSHPAVVGIVSRMEQKGHLTTWMDPKNRRNKIVRLTPQAQALSETMDAMRRHWEETMLRDFSEGEAEQLKVFLVKINQNLE
ncbi:MAG: MarR family winged helix-turn-helix transcriptional regulator [Faecousia sp.]